MMALLTLNMEYVMLGPSRTTVIARDTLAREISARTPGLDEAGATRIVDIVVGEIAAALRKTGDVTVPSLGRFRIKKRAARRGINPRTREMVDYPAREVIKLSVSKWFEAKVFDAS